MTKPLISLLAAVAFAACGSKPSSTPTTPSQPTESTEPMHDHADHDHPGVAPDSTGAAPAPAPEAPKPDRPMEASKPDPAKGKADLLAAEMSAWEAAKPVFTKACATCHTKAGKKAAKKKLDHFDMDTYPPGGHHTGTIGFTIREVLGLTSKKATMPYDKPGSVQGDDLVKIKAWADAWEASDKAGAHPPAASHKHDD